MTGVRYATYSATKAFVNNILTVKYRSPPKRILSTCRLPSSYAFICCWVKNFLTVDSQIIWRLLQNDATIVVVYTRRWEKDISCPQFSYLLFACSQYQKRFDRKLSVASRNTVCFCCCVKNRCMIRDSWITCQNIPRCLVRSCGRWAEKTAHVRAGPAVITRRYFCRCFPNTDLRFSIWKIA